MNCRVYKYVKHTGSKFMATFSSNVLFAVHNHLQF